MAEIIHMHKAKKRPRPRTFVQAGDGATILMFTGVRYERSKPENRVRKSSGKRVTGR